MQLADSRSTTIDEETEAGFGERLLIETWRRIAVGRGGCPLIKRDFAAACGEDGREVLATVVTFLQALAYSSRRRLVVGHPGRAVLTADERHVLHLVDAAQREEFARFEADLEWLARGEARATLALGARALASALNEHGLRLVATGADRSFGAEPRDDCCKSNRVGAAQ